jgi:hypothetical protein
MLKLGIQTDTLKKSSSACTWLSIKMKLFGKGGVGLGIDFGCFKGEDRFENLRTTSGEYVNKVANYAESMDGEDQSWSVSEAITILKNAMKENNKKASDVFSSIDVNDDGKINGPELYKGLIEHIGHHLSPGQVSMIINALDTNDDNRIDLEEFSVALEEEE